MFSRVFNTARQILSRSPSAQGRSEDCIEENTAQGEAQTETTMVTTRSGNGTGPSVENTPRSSARKTRGKRELSQEEDTPAATKRIRRSVGTKKTATEQGEEVPPTPKPRAEDPQRIALDTPPVSIPDRTISAQEISDQLELPSSGRRGRPKVVIPKKPSTPSASQQSAAKKVDEEPSTTRESEFYTPGTYIASPEFVTPAMYRDTAGSPTPKPAKSSITTRTQVSNDDPSIQEAGISHQVLNQASDNAPTPTQDSIPTSSLRKTHMRFDSEEPDVNTTHGADTQPTLSGSAIQPNNTTEVQIDDHDDDASDSDEAPDVVTAATAATKVKAIQDEAARARKTIQDKDDLKKQKRMERIAEEQAEKRKREEAKAKKAAKQQAKEEQRRAKRENASSRNQTLDFNMDSLPALLPDSVLDAVGSHRAPTPPPVRTAKSAEQLHKEKLQRHIKFLEQGEKSIKDVKRGSINVSVLAQQNALLAPKVKRDTKNIREHWLKGRQQEKMGRMAKGKMQHRRMERKATGGGFLRGGDD
ncbi:hypothetical protein DM02DRAFT_14422 [Periconia macrospinosa]|uniref:Uncharacterized protein n=1 Tax=Periconia macrospinosa TaxID=97972 RepID=A0A2V1E864_9PLEO|nr:hypothetical protein DM02DRAFT_14422 [Periconia macrospinosa]